MHFVDEEYDRGVIAAQRTVPVLREDTAGSLARRVLEQARARERASSRCALSLGALSQEWALYADVVGALCAGRLAWRDDGVPWIED